MQFLSINSNTSLLELSSQVGTRNVDSILNANSIERQPNIGKALSDMSNSVIATTSEVDKQRKVTVLNTLTSDSDVFETAALSSESNWKLLSNVGTFPNMLKIPETITLPDSVNILGNHEPVKREIYDEVIKQVSETGTVDPAVFNEYSSRQCSHIVNVVGVSNPLQWFKLPWGVITLYSSLSGTSVDFPVFPEELKDGRQAQYDQMPDMLYQYESWQVYKGSGDRSNTYTFKMHRDMWTGDHRDGKCNELIRFCEANCYPEYKGAAIQTATVTLYISGKPLISGIMINTNTHYEGPIGLDNYPLVCTLDITITEVSPTPLNFTTMSQKGLIG